MLCSFVTCTNPAKSKGLCDGHAQQRYRGKPLTPLKETKVKEAKNNQVWTPASVDRAWKNRLSRGKYTVEDSGVS